MPESAQKPMPTDRIEKKILLRAPLKRVWRALSDSKEFGAWFGVKFDAPFTPGAHLRGKIVGSAVDPAVAKAQKQHEHVPFGIIDARLDGVRMPAKGEEAFRFDAVNGDFAKSPRRSSNSLWKKSPTASSLP